MEFSTNFEPLSDSIESPITLVNKIDELLPTIQRIEIFRFTETKTSKVNEITFARDVQGHPRDDASAISLAITQVVVTHATREGLAAYRCAIWIKEEPTATPCRRMYTFRVPDMREYIEEDSFAPQPPNPDGTGESAFQFARDAMQVVATTVSEGLKQSYAHNEALHGTLLSHSKTSTAAMDAMHQLVATLIGQVRDASLQKDRALGLIHETRQAELEAEASNERTKIVGGMLRPALMILANQIGAKFGVDASALMTDEEKAEAQDNLADTRANAPATDTETDTETDHATRKAAILQRLKTEPIVCSLETLESTVTTDQWHQIYSLKPAATGARVGATLHTTLAIRDEPQAQAAVAELAVYIGATPKVQTHIAAVLTPDQQNLVASLVRMAASATPPPATPPPPTDA